MKAAVLYNLKDDDYNRCKTKHLEEQTTYEILYRIRKGGMILQVTKDKTSDNEVIHA